MAVTIQQLSQWKQQGRLIVALTAWDYAIANVLDAVWCGFNSSRRYFSGGARV